MAVRSIVFAALVLLSALQLRAEDGPKDEDDLSFFMPMAPLQRPEKLQRLVLLAKSIREKSQKEPEAVAQAIAAAACTLPPVALERALNLIKDIPPAAQAHLPAVIELFASVRELGTAAECLEHPNTPHGSPRPLKYIIAANLFECEAIMPFWILEVLRLALLLRNDPLVQRAYFHNITEMDYTSSVSISIYESGSQDSTVQWLRIAEALWTAVGIPNTVVINGLLTRQTLMDPFSGAFYKQHRIEYLASLRNAAMEPVYASPPGTYDYVIFINDVFFCAPDMLRLAAYEADISCGLDFEVWIGNKKGRASGVTQRFLRRRLMQAAGGSGSGQSIVADANAVVTYEAAVEHLSQVYVEESARQAAADARVLAAKIKPRYEFYDTWVSRDIGGNPYIKTDPIARDFRTIDLLHRGLPFPVKCCWNGMVVINATHLSKGLKFRAAIRTDGEYDISECSLFCEDYRRLGATNVVVDPSVRVSYLVWTKEFHGKLPGGVGAKVPWPLVQRSGALTQLRSLWSETRDCMKMTWVPLKKFAEEADLEKFRVIDLRSVNYTHMFLERLKQRPAPPARPTTCNLILGPYGANGDGIAFDDLSLSGFGANPITRITSSNTTALQSLQVDYGSKPGLIHGVQNNTASVAFSAGESVSHAVVYFDNKEVFGMVLTTSTGRNVTIGVTDHEDASYAWATPCPGDAAHAGKYRLISFAGTAEKVVRSLTLVWTPVSSS